MKFTECSLCHKNISNNNYKRHFIACDGNLKFPKIRGIDFDPNIGYRNGSRIAWNKGLTKENNAAILLASLKLKEKWKTGQVKSGHSKERREKQSVFAKSQKFGGYRKNAGRSKKFKVLDSFR